MVPKALGRSGMSNTGFRLYVELAHHANTPGNCYPSHQRLADLMGCSVSSVRRAAAELVGTGWITIFPRFDADGAQIPSGYILRDAAVSRA